MYNKLKINILIVFIMNTISKFLGFFRDVVLVNKLGVTEYTDAFLGATAVIDFLIVISGLQAFFSIATTTFTEFIPIEKEKSKFFTSFISLQLTIALSLSVLTFLYPELFINSILSGLSFDAKVFAAKLLRIISINVTFISLHKTLNSILGVYKKFFLQNIWLLIINLSIISVILISPNNKILISISITVVLVHLFSIFSQILLLKKEKLTFTFMKLQYLKEKWKYIISLFLPLLLVTSFESISGIVDKIIASYCSKGTITSLGLAYNLTFFTVSALLFPIIRVVFPEFSKLFLNKELEKLQNLFNKTLEMTILIFLPIALYIAFFNEELIFGIYYRNNFSLENVKMVSNILFIYGISLIFNVLYMVPVFLMQATKNNKSMGRIGAFSFVINIISSIIFSKIWGYIGIPLGTLLSFFIYSILLFLFINYKLEIKLSKNIFISCVIIFLISFISKYLINTLLNVNFSIPIISFNQYINNLLITLFYFPLMIMLYSPFFFKIQNGSLKLKK